MWQVMDGMETDLHKIIQSGAKLLFLFIVSA